MTDDANNGKGAKSAREMWRKYTRGELFLHNLPYYLMVLLGSAMFYLTVPGPLAARWAAIVVYVAYSVFGPVWMMFFICPSCHLFDTRSCPSGYGRVAGRLTSRGTPTDFRKQFLKHIPVLFPLWFAPVIVSGIVLFHHFTWGLAMLTAVFALNSFIILPWAGKRYGCNECPQKDNCPFMKKGNKSQGESDA